MRTATLASVLVAFLSVLLLTACETAPKTAAERRTLQREAEALIDEWTDIDPGMREFFEDSYGYVVFPTVGKGGLIVGGSYGRGVVFKDGEVQGYADVTSGTFGLQAGGQGFSQIIFFQTRSTYSDFIDGKFSLSAQASAVAVDAGASAQTRYRNGVAVFIRGESGAMLEASIGGQGFSYKPLSYYDE